jgi:Dolichyl-phosphate-mannose-protein mannosyltransferase
VAIKGFPWPLSGFFIGYSTVARRMIRGQHQSSHYQWIMSVAIGVAAFLLAASRVNHGLVDSALPAGPGLTTDESFNIQQGVYLAHAIADHGPLIFTPHVARKVFAEPAYLPDHPPLGRLLLGFVHESTDWLVEDGQLGSLSVVAARLSSCLAFALTAWLLCEFCRRQFGFSVAVLAGTLLLLMPRVVGHARIASLETVTGLMWFVALVPLLTWFTRERPPTLRQAAVAGALWGLLMLTKVQGVLLPPVFLLWMAWRFRWNAWRVVAVWTTTGAAVWFMCWPWLWNDPVQNVLQYLGRTGIRTTLNTWYLGEPFADRGVPWHYPFVMTFSTLPVVVAVGLAVRGRLRNFDRVEQLLCLSVIVPLLVFGCPGTPVYDGVRLFLVVMPAIAILAAVGLQRLWQMARPVNENPNGMPSRNVLPWIARGCLLLTAGTVPWSVAAVNSPFAISRYSLSVYGGPGAEWLQLESSYWGDGLNGEFWSQVPEGAEVFVAPVTHQIRLSAIEQLVPIVRERRIRLTSFLYDSKKQRGLLLLIHRLADLRPSLQSPPVGAKVVAEVRADGRILAQLLDTTDADWIETP